MTETAESNFDLKFDSRRNRPLMVHLRTSLSLMKKAEVRVAEFILDHPEDVLKSTVASLSERCSVSVGSVVSFCKRLGFNGYADFKIALARNLAEAGLPAVAGTSKSSLETLLKYHAESLLETLSMNSQETFDEVVSSLRRAKRIEIFSIGISYPVAYTAAVKLMLIGLDASAQFDSHVQVSAASRLGPGDVAFAISPTGAAREIAQCLELAREKGAKTICITNTVGSEITKNSDACLYATPNEVRYFQAALPSSVTQIALIDSIFVALAKSQSKKATQFLQSSGEALMRYR